MFFDSMKVTLMFIFNGLKKRKTGKKNFPKERLHSSQNILFINIKQKEAKVILRSQMMRKLTIS